MALYDPTGGSPAIPQSGTYNGNPLVAVAGLATLNAMTPDAYRHIDALTRYIAAGLKDAFKSADTPGSIVVAGSLFRIYFLDRAPANYRQAARDSSEKHRWLYFYLLNKGIAIRQGGCVSLPMTTDHADRLIDRLARGLARLAVLTRDISRPTTSSRSTDMAAPLPAHRL